jgi:hypothetical protein
VLYHFDILLKLISSYDARFIRWEEAVVGCKSMEEAVVGCKSILNYYVAHDMNNCIFLLIGTSQSQKATANTR